MATELALRTILYLLDGAVWVFSCAMILTKFYGYPSKPSSKRKWVFFCAIVIYTFINIVLYYVCTKYGITMGVINGLLVVFNLIYWAFYLQEPGRIKRILLVIFALEFCTSVVNLVICAYSTFLRISGGSVVATYLITCLQLVLTLGFFMLISWFSARRRKEPMRFSLVVSTFIMCLFLDMVMDFFQVEGYDEIQPVIRLRLLFKDGNDQVMSEGVFLIITVVVLLFIVMLVRESESDYFQKRNTISEYYLETQKSHYESLMESNRKIRRLKHDMKNHIYCLQGLYQSGQYEELGAYLEQISQHLEQIDTSVHVGNEIADAIISEKMTAARQRDILFEVDGDMFGVQMSALDVCTIFSNMIDNAMEAVEILKTEERKIQLNIRKTSNFLLITEKNPTASPIEIHDNRIATTKKHKGSHGFGIVNMTESVEKYNGECRMSVTEDEKEKYEFQIDIMIPLEVHD
jgi:hypothetical protein